VSLADDARRALAGASRELRLVCDRDGVIRWCDEDAARLLGLEPGRRLVDLAVPGTDDKVRELIARGEGDHWELALVAGGAPVTISFVARPIPDGVALLGHVIPRPFVDALHQVDRMVADVVELNRRIIHQARELQESNRGLLTLHAELEDRAAALRHAQDLEQRLISSVSHELRTPVHSILGLTQLLLDGIDGSLGPEQRKQVEFVRSSAEELSHLVDDLLDLRKLEAGKFQLRLERFDLAEFLGSMRGMLRPLLPAGSPVELAFTFDETPREVRTDRAKLSQVVRNLVSNAIKFTAEGEIRVTARVQDGTLLVLSVRDTGVGIAEADRDAIFEEYRQVDNPLQGRVKGTGLGLPLARRLVQMLGGTIEVESRVGEGSTFTVRVPLDHGDAVAMDEMIERSRREPAGPTSVLVIEDDHRTLFMYEKYLTISGFHVLPARSIDEARAHLAITRPLAIVLDVMLEGESSWGFLTQLKADPVTRDIPVMVVTVTNRAQQARALGADEFWLKPLDQDKLVRKLRDLIDGTGSPRVLVIDDDETSRYLVRKHLQDTPYALLEAASGAEGLTMTHELHPHVILLDFLLEDVTAFDVLDELKADPRTRGIPVIVVTSLVLGEQTRARLLEQADAVISKQHLSRELALSRIRDALRKLESARGRG
jgi:signal transduction histidine kinase/DNA-binding response OmpR family regulator